MLGDHEVRGEPTVPKIRPADGRVFSRQERSTDIYQLKEELLSGVLSRGIRGSRLIV